MGPTHVQGFLSSLEIPSPTVSTIKRREREMLDAIENVAEVSCNQAIEEEKRLSTGDDGKISGHVKYDMGWQKRGSGRSYNSSTGVGTSIGEKSGKVLAFSVKNKECRICEIAQNNGRKVKPHNCQKNWIGSSKAMEPAAGADLAKQVEEKGLPVDILIMDEDATTIPKIVAALQHSVIKWSDMNHIRKHLGNSLYALQKEHRKSLPVATITWLQKCFTYAVAQNKGSAENVEAAIKTIVPHAFGEHDKCGAWCQYKADPDNYTHKHTPNGEDLQSEKLKEGLTAVFNKLASNSAKIAPYASTKDVESFNNIVASKAPKARHYAGSEALTGRVNCAVAQKNCGIGYVSQVNEHAGLSPGKIFKKYAAALNKKRKRQVEKENTKQFKRRKLEKKFAKSQSEKAKTIREGPTYESNIGLEQEQNDPEDEVIPPHIPAPVMLPVSDKDLPLVYFDLETTSSTTTAQITQTGCVSGSKEFSQYGMPTEPIQKIASEVTGLTMHGGELLLHGVVVPAVGQKSLLINFLSWLDEEELSPCILVGHNMRAFDSRKMVQNVQQHGLLGAFKERVVGFMDTLPAFKKNFPGRTNGYKQETLVKDLIGEEYSGHDAIEDVRALQKVTAAKLSTEKLFPHSFTTMWLCSMMQYETGGKQKATTFSPMIKDKKISPAMAGKCSKSGLELRHLKLAYQRDGEEGVQSLLRELDSNRKPRVTARKDIIHSICQWLDANK